MPGEPRLILNGLALGDAKGTFDLHLLDGECLAIAGPAASGKSLLVACLLNEAEPSRGRIIISSPIVSTRAKVRFGRQTVGQIVKGLGSDSAFAEEVLERLALKRYSSTRPDDLSSSQKSAFQIAMCLCSEGSVIVLDGQLDFLDDWVLPEAVALLRKQSADGTSVVVTTRRVDLLHDFDKVILLKQCEPVFLGTVTALKQLCGPEQVTVQTSNGSEMKHLMETFSIEINQMRDGFKFTAHEGQELAAKLLVHGYGDVRAVVVHSPDLESTIKAMLI